MKKIMLLLFMTTYIFASSYEHLTLEKALTLLKRNNIDIKIASYEEEISKLQVKIARGHQLGKLDATLIGMRSNDAGNIFGFKLESREATFGDFGFAENVPGVPLNTQPVDLNYPKSRNHFQTRIKYQLPLFTGGMLSYYKDIAKTLVVMKKLDKSKIVAHQVYQTKKTFYDLSLLNIFRQELLKVDKNMHKLERTVKAMREEGYAKKTDLLEVQARAMNLKRMLGRVKGNEKLAYQFLSFLLNHEVSAIQTGYIDAKMTTLSNEEILARNSDMKKVQKGYEIQANMVKVKRAEFLPKIGAFAEYGSSDDKLFNDFEKHDSYTVGGQISLNLFNGGIDYYAHEQEKLKQYKVGQQVELAKKGIALKILKTRTEIENLDLDIGSLKKEYQLARTIYQTYYERHRENVESINNVLIKESISIEKLLTLQEAINKRNERVLALESLANGDVL